MLTEKEKGMLAYMLYVEKRNWTAVKKLEEAHGITISDGSDLSVNMFDFVMGYIGIPKGAANDKCFDMFASEGKDFTKLINTITDAAEKVLPLSNDRKVLPLSKGKKVLPLSKHEELDVLAREGDFQDYVQLILDNEVINSHDDCIAALKRMYDVSDISLATQEQISTLKESYQRYMNNVE